MHESLVYIHLYDHNKPENWDIQLEYNVFYKYNRVQNVNKEFVYNFTEYLKL
jgi:hypothetical protein